MSVTAGPVSGPDGLKDPDWLKDHEQADRGLLSHSLAPDLPAAGAALGLAVSGGSDSMAMLHLMAAAAPHRGWRLSVATVDHRLRPEAAEEAAFVGETCARLGLPHQVLVWDDHPQSGNLMQAASDARYDLLAAWAKGQGIGHIATAHTANDQAETFLIGLSRRAGLEGLSGMRPLWQQAGVTFLRPYLAATRSALRDYLRRHGLVWRDDPSNTDDRYARVRARKALELLAPLGISAEGLGESIRHLAAVQQTLAQELAAVFSRIGAEDHGMLRLERAGFVALAPEMQRKLIMAALHWMSGSRHAPRAAAVARLIASVLAGQPATLGGCAFRLTQSHLTIRRELRAVTGLTTPSTALWDGRWQLIGPHDPGLSIRALGSEGLAQLEAHMPDWRRAGVPRAALLVSPGIWRGLRLEAAPLAGFGVKWRAKPAQAFGMFIISH